MKQDDALAEMPPFDHHERDFWRWCIKHYDTIKQALTNLESVRDKNDQ